MRACVEAENARLVAELARGRAISVEHAHGLTVDWIVLRTPICPAIDMDPAQVLERNARLAFAAIVLAHDVYWLRVALPVDSTELADPRRLIALVVDAAASLAPRPDLGIAASHMFDHFTS